MSFPILAVPVVSIRYGDDAAPVATITSSPIAILLLILIVILAVVASFLMLLMTLPFSPLLLLQLLLGLLLLLPTLLLRPPLPLFIVVIDYSGSNFEVNIRRSIHRFYWFLQQILRIKYRKCRRGRRFYWPCLNIRGGGWLPGNQEEGAPFSMNFQGNTRILERPSGIIIIDRNQRLVMIAFVI